MKEAVIKRYPYFRVSSVEQALCSIRWLYEHLTATGVPTCVVRHGSTRRGRYSYSVWRQGTESVTGDQQANSEPIKGDIIMGCNFDLIL